MAFVTSIADRLELPWDRNDLGKTFVQKVLTERCVKLRQRPDDRLLHGGDRRPRLRLNDVLSHPHARPERTRSHDVLRSSYAGLRGVYVSIFYPAALDMEMGRAAVQGTPPPKWGVPGSARASKLIEKINLRAPDGTTPWPTPLHPEDKGEQHT